ncbi:hypothetical protein A3L11_05830 [Thermococcus siculi]|uniref:Uncharacterized protein n=1 Tax=Thermococcus siculi TaxID=72803 RepID=A0A2Z2MK50_9EURY|nr:hypothetical protein A3L11_05830 [Thermococcus siculi]
MSRRKSALVFVLILLFLLLTLKGDAHRYELESAGKLVELRPQRVPEARTRRGAVSKEEVE